MATTAFNKRVTVAAAGEHFLQLPNTWENAIGRDVIVEAVPGAGATANVYASAAPQEDVQAWIAAEADTPGSGATVRPNVFWFPWASGAVVAATQDVARLASYLRLTSAAGTTEFNVRQF